VARPTGPLTIRREKIYQSTFSLWPLLPPLLVGCIGSLRVVPLSALEIVSFSLGGLL